VKVVKKNGVPQDFSKEKLELRLKKVVYGLSSLLEVDLIIDKVAAGLYDGVTTTEIDDLASEEAAYMITKHPDYSKLASRIWMTRLHKNTKSDHLDVLKDLYNYINPKNGAHQPKVSLETLEIATKYNDELSKIINYERDSSYDYFGLKTLERSYLIKIDGKIVERPQHMLMRVAIGIHGDSLEDIKETYELLSKKYFTHATPTLFNAGTPHPQMSSCFLLTMEDDSIAGIYKTLGNTAQISRFAGGIGLSIHNVRATGSYISGTGGHSNGIIPMLQVYNNTARYVDQGGGKRKGSFAIYLEPWHADIFEFLDLKKNHGKEELRARDLFYAMWVPDLFMERTNKC
jgi:ribonucleoside-diphosphate reductase alpha chain